MSEISKANEAEGNSSAAENHQGQSSERWVEPPTNKLKMLIGNVAMGALMYGVILPSITAMNIKEGIKNRFSHSQSATIESDPNLGQA